MAGSIRESLARRHVGDPLARGEGPRLSMELPDRELGPCEGFLAVAEPPKKSGPRALIVVLTDL